MKVTKPSFNPGPSDIKKIKIILGLLLLLGMILLFTALKDNDTLLTHKQANTLFSQDKIQKVIIDGEYLRLKTKDNSYKIYKEAINQNAFFTKYLVEVNEDSKITTLFLLLTLLFGLVGLLYIFFLQKTSYQDLKRIKSSNTTAENYVAPIKAITTQITFNDVAGINDVKEELEEIIDFLKFPQKYKNLDIRLPKGVLLVGPPGVGKTLIAKAVAGEAGVPFYYQSGASFVHIYVGMGAKRVSELFQKAKQNAPSIIFIDEIDAVGKSRGVDGNDEREATLNQLLTEMDGFEESSGVIVIGATNKIEVLDEALLRAGRFDRRIHISLPDIEERAKTLELYLKNKPHQVNIEGIAHNTVGFNSAALATLTNEAAIFAMRKGRDQIENSDFEAVKDKVILGKRRLQSFSKEEREIQAVYQGAKALCATWLDVDFEKIGIVLTRFSEPDKEILSKSQVLNRIKVYLAGSVATQKIYNEQFTNASKDITIAKELANKLIYEYAMSENFTTSVNEVETLLKQSKVEMIALLDKLEAPLNLISTHLLGEENITQETCKKILRDLF